MIQDSDRTSAAFPIRAEKTAWLQDMQARPNTTAFLTRKHSMGNYFHPDTLRRLTNDLLSLHAGIDLDFVKMADELSRYLTAARQNSRQTGLNYQLDDHSGVRIRKTNAGACTIITCAYIMRHMTAEEIRQRASYQDGPNTKYEVMEWIEAIQAHLLNSASRRVEGNAFPCLEMPSTFFTIPSNVIALRNTQ